MRFRSAGSDKPAFMKQSGYWYLQNERSDTQDSVEHLDHERTVAAGLSFHASRWPAVFPLHERADVTQ